jgi:hypothetical protein
MKRPKGGAAQLRPYVIYPDERVQIIYATSKTQGRTAPPLCDLSGRACLDNLCHVQAEHAQLRHYVI